jgi:hypothetical protein
MTDFTEAEAEEKLRVLDLCSGLKGWTEVEAEEKWIIYGYDAQDFEVFVYINNSRPDPKEFALDVMEHRYDYDEETDEWYDRAGDKLSDAISEGPFGWSIHCMYDGTFEGMKVEANPISRIQSW